MKKSESWIGKEGHGVPRYIFAGDIFKDDIILSATGLELNVTVRPDKIIIYDNSNKIRHFCAYRDFPKIANFSIRTESIIGDRDSRHPDLFPSILYEEAINYFNRQGEQIRIIHNQLIESSERGLNTYYMQYKQALSKVSPNKNEVEMALKSTGAYKLGERIGFTEIANIHFYNKSESDGTHTEIVTFDSMIP